MPGKAITTALVFGTACNEAFHFTIGGGETKDLLNMDTYKDIVEKVKNKISPKAKSSTAKPEVSKSYNVDDILKKEQDIWKNLKSNAKALQDVKKIMYETPTNKIDEFTSEIEKAAVDFDNEWHIRDGVQELSFRYLDQQRIDDVERENVKQTVHQILFSEDLPNRDAVYGRYH